MKNCKYISGNRYYAWMNYLHTIIEENLAHLCYIYVKTNEFGTI